MDKKKVFVWSLYDFANSSYAVIIVAFVYPVFFKETVNNGEPIGDFYWALGINISMILSAILNPVCGAIADFTSSKKKFLFFFTMLSVVCTALMYFTGPGTVVYALIVFILSNIGFQTALTFYDAFIPEIAQEKQYNKLSSIGYAVGYIGSLIAVLLVIPLLAYPNILFVVTAFMFLIFSIPLFLFLEEKKNKNVSDVNYVTYGFSKAKNAFKDISKIPNLRNFLLAFFFYIDAVNTIIFFAGLYASSTLGFSIMELTLFFVIVQVMAAIGSYSFSFIGNKFGVLKSIFLTLFFWMAITLAVFFTDDKIAFYIIGGFAGIFLGSTQALSRAMMARLTPYDMRATLFGFYALMEKTSTLLGPLTFGLVSWLSGSQKFAVLSVGVFFAVGMLFLSRVKDIKQHD